MLRNFSIFILSALVIMPGQLSGCEVGPDYKRPSITQRVASSSCVVEGVAEEIKDKSIGKNERAARVHVTRWIKGNGPSHIVIYNFGWGPDCLSPVPTGKSVFFANEISPSDYKLHYEGVLDAVIPATPSNISEIEKALENSGTGKNIKQ